MPDSGFLFFAWWLPLGAVLGLMGAGAALSWGIRSAERFPGESRWPTCMFCLKPLRIRDLLPLVGWAFRPGGPRALSCPCGLRRGLWRRPVAEGVGALLGFMAACALGGEPSWVMIPLAFGLGILPGITLVDLTFGVIPDELNLALGLAGLATLIGTGEVFTGLITSAGLLALGLILALVYSEWRGREMLGLGDVKFFAAAGLWLPMEFAPWFLGLAGVVGMIFGILWKRRGGGHEFPFAPALCVALAVCVLARFVLVM